MGGLLNSYRRERNGLFRGSVTLPIICSFGSNGIEYIEARNDLAKRGVIRRELGILEDKEELAAVGASSSVGHSQGASRVGRAREIFVREGVTGAPRTSGRGVPALEGGETRGIEEAVALGAIEVALARQEGERIAGARSRCVELHYDGAAVSDHSGGLCSWGGLCGWEASELLITSGRTRVGAINAGNGGGCGAGSGCT